MRRNFFLRYITRVCPGFFIGGKTEDRERGWGSYEGATTPSPPSRGSGERCGSPKWGSGQSPDQPKVFRCFRHSGWPLLTLSCGVSYSHWGKTPEARLPGWHDEKNRTLDLFPSSVRESKTEVLNMYTYVYICVWFELKFSTGLVAPTTGQSGSKPDT